MLVDEEGRNYIAAQLDDRAARLYQGAIFREDDAGEDLKPDEDENCGGGCSCGH